MFVNEKKIDNDDWNNTEENGPTRVNKSTSRCDAHQTNDRANTRSRDWNMTTNGIDQGPGDQASRRRCMCVDQSQRS